MKYPESQFKTLVKELPVILNHYGIDKNALPLSIGSLHTLHCRLFQQKNYTNDNSNVWFVENERVMPVDESFKLYPDGCNDDHVETAMKAAIKQIFN